MVYPTHGRVDSHTEALGSSPASALAKPPHPPAPGFTLPHWVGRGSTVMTSRGLVQRDVWMEGVCASQALSGHRPHCCGSQKTLCWRHCGFEPSGQAGSSRCSRSPAPGPSVTPAETVWPNWSTHGECSGPCPPPRPPIWSWNRPLRQYGWAQGEGCQIKQPSSLPFSPDPRGRREWLLGFPRARPLACFRTTLRGEVATWPRFSMLLKYRSLA